MNTKIDTSRIREPAVAGMFYPAEQDRLHATVRHMLREAEERPADDEPRQAEAGDDKLSPRAIIGPHAGYRYSGPVAASAYRRLYSLADRIERVVLIGPSHRVAFEGLAASGAGRWRTPLGDIEIDRDGTEAALGHSAVRVIDQAHQHEHGLEVHLPFLTETIGSYRLVPLVIGESTGKHVAEVIERLWDEGTLIVISSDLSHYYPYEEARRRDRATCEAIESLSPDSIGNDDACGYLAVQGMLQVAQGRGLKVTTLDLRNSGDTAGPRDQVVGYGAWIFA